MSESGKERSRLGGGCCGGRSGDDEDDGGDRKNENEHGCENCGKRGKRVALFRFRKVKKPFQRRNKKSNYSSNLGKRVCGGGGGGGGSGCYFCLKQPQTLDSPGESQTRDPNNPEFTYEILGPVIEKNDFYSKECNTHLDDI
ncbi:unnamed protein product [Ilex paraguariensis]|uniref:Uncharacterized protein n=1 Tax=Ilex paraguariensis TaxID=185542 RepID=A0ABC8SCS7_9AQUA